MMYICTNNPKIGGKKWTMFTNFTEEMDIIGCPPAYVDSPRSFISMPIEISGILKYPVVLGIYPELINILEHMSRIWPERVDERVDPG